MEDHKREQFNAILADFEQKKEILSELDFKFYVDEIEENNPDLQPYFEVYFDDIFLHSNSYWLVVLSMRKLLLKYKRWNDTYRKRCHQYLFEGAYLEYQFVAWRAIEENDAVTEEVRNQLYYKILKDAKELEDEEGIKSQVLKMIMYHFAFKDYNRITRNSDPYLPTAELLKIIVGRGEKYYREFLKSVGATEDPLGILKDMA